MRLANRILRFSKKAFALAIFSLADAEGESEMGLMEDKSSDATSMSIRDLIVFGESNGIFSAWAIISPRIDVFIEICWVG